jgi:hypothetical protein
MRRAPHNPCALFLGNLKPQSGVVDPQDLVVMPPDYEALRANAPALAPHQRRWAWALAAAILVPGVGVGVWAATELGSKGWCVTVVIAGPIGGADLQHCGAGARKWCTAEAAAASGDNIAAQVRAACRRSGVLPH